VDARNGLASQKYYGLLEVRESEECDAVDGVVPELFGPRIVLARAYVLEEGLSDGRSMA